MGSLASLDGCRKSCPLPGYFPWIVQPVVSFYTDYTILALFIIFHFTYLLKQNSVPVDRCAQHFQRVSAARNSGGIDEEYNSSLEPATASHADNLIPVHTATSSFLNIQFAILLSFTHTHTHTHTCTHTHTHTHTHTKGEN